MQRDLDEVGDRCVGAGGVDRFERALPRGLQFGERIGGTIECDRGIGGGGAVGEAQQLGDVDVPGR